MSTIDDIFGRLGEGIAREWRRCGHAAENFPEIAATALQSEPLVGRVGYRDIATWFLEAVSVPEQFVGSLFGEPPINLFKHERFYIEALFWMNGTTAIHDHDFRGAFLVLDGSSVHTRYRFVEERHVRTSFRLGRLQHLGSELLERGSIRPIVKGDGLVHSLFHLDSPSLTVVVRTYGDPGGHPQLVYQWPCVASLSPAAAGYLARRLQLLAVLREADPAGYRRALDTLLAGCDIEESFFVLEACFRHAASRDLVPTLLARVADRHHLDAASWSQAFQERRRQDHLVAMRARVRSPELRFFLALLMNVPDRMSLFAAVGQRHADPTTTILDWLRELNAIDGAPLGACLDAPSMTILESLVRGETLPECVARVGSLYDANPDEAADIADVRASIAELPVLRPLFAT